MFGTRSTVARPARKSVGLAQPISEARKENPPRAVLTSKAALGSTAAAVTTTPLATTAPCRPFRIAAGCVVAFHEDAPSVESLPLKRYPRSWAIRPGVTVMLPYQAAV